MDADALAIGARVRDQRERREMSQVDLAKAIGTSQAAISEYERGLAMPQVPTLRALAAALEVSLGWLIDGRRYAKARRPRKRRASRQPEGPAEKGAGQ